MLVLPLLIVARLIGRPPALVFTLGGVIVVVAFALAMLHRDRYARAVLAGLLAGLPTFALPVILRSLGILRLGSGDLDPCLPASLVSGILAGAFVAARAGDEKHRRTYWLAAAGMAAAIGTLGCSVVGVAGVLGLLGGFAAGTAPAVVRGNLRPDLTVTLLRVVAIPPITPRRK